MEANALGVRAVGCDVSEFNCLLSRVKTTRYERYLLLADVEKLEGRREGVAPVQAATAYLRRWFAERALAELLAFRDALAETVYSDLWRVVLSRAARSARLARHDDLDFPREPVLAEYFCHKHRRMCRPVGEADKFLRRYVADAVRRVLEFDAARTDAQVTVIAGDARLLDPPEPVDLVLTSPPYPGLIDYHEQHAYAFELLALRRRDGDEIGRGLRGYCDAMATVLVRARDALLPGGRVVLVVNDSRGIYDGILSAAGLHLEERLLREVNRRTGRRAGPYYEEILVARP